MCFFCYNVGEAEKVSAVSSGSQPQSDNTWKTKVTGSMPRSGGVLVLTKAKLFPDKLPTREMASFQSPHIHPPDPIEWNGQKWKDGCSRGALRFNDVTRQSTTKVMLTCRENKPELVYLMQQPHCLAAPYLKSMISAGWTAVASCNFDIISTLQGKKNGGGSLPLFLASKIQGAIVDVVEIDPLVISASIRAMGFPTFSLMTKSMRGFAFMKQMLRNL
ncbi:hypothetical protein TSUD_68230 [Trifolium subterraneum]|uniref:Uncharacterized protein n=1 Tax=Trifolium subterraneum TaxID=3900 RepID=A0A2Z6N5X3_TRISU|nr:hypothetical protein TSUD_68230 [Trifolium subterraneum]